MLWCVFFIVSEKHYGYNCPKCGYDFIGLDDYEVDGEKYPKISNESCYEGVEDWTENHKCPNCKIEVEYNDGT